MVPYVRKGAASRDLAKGVHQVRQEAEESEDRHQGEDSSCSGAAGDSLYYVVETAPFVQAEGLLCFEVGAGRHIPVGGSSCSEAGVLVLVECSYYGEGLAQG